VFVANLMRLPKVFPKLRFSIDYLPPPSSGAAAAPPAERALGGST